MEMKTAMPSNVKRSVKPRLAIGTVYGTRVAPGSAPMTRHAVLFLFAFLMLLCAGPAFAQAPAEPPKEPPPPLWDLQVGASFVGTSGNSDTASTGADFAGHRRGEV